MLQKQIIDIELAQGIETQVDDKIVQGKNLVLENATFNKFKALQKCGGFSEYPHATLDDGSILGSVESVFKNGKSLMCVTSDRSFYRFDEIEQKWRRLEGALFPSKMDSYGVKYSGNTQNKPDIDFNERLGFVATVFEEFRPTVAGDYRVVLTVKDIDKEEENSVVVEVDSRNPRVACFDNGDNAFYVVYYVESGSISYKIYNSSLVEIKKGFFTGDTSVGVISHDRVGDSSYLIFKDTSIATDSRITIFDFDFDNPTTPIVNTSLYSNPDGFNNKGFRVLKTDTNIFYASINNDDNVELIGYNLDNTIVTHPRNEVIIEGSLNMAPDKVEIGVNSGVLTVFVGGLSDTIGYGTRVDTILAFTFDISIGLFTPINEYKSYGMVMRSNFIQEGSYFYGLVAHKSSVQATDFFCRISVSIEPFEIIESTTKAVKVDILANTLKGASSGVGDFSLQSSIKKSGACFYIAHERARRFIAETDESTDGSSIFVLKVDMGDFSAQFDEFGSTSLVVGGLVLDTDGDTVSENGFMIAPEVFKIGDNGAGSLTAGTRGYKLVYEHYNSKGELVRSTPSASKSFTNTASKENIISFVASPFTYRGKNSSKVVVYRTIANGTVHHRLKAFELSAEYFPYEEIATVDDISDSAIESNEILYTEGGEIQNDSAPYARSVTVAKNRVFLADLDIPNEIGYSKLGQYEIGPSFSDFYRIAIDSSQRDEKGTVKAVSALDDKIILFKESAIYYIVGSGPNNNGLDDDFSTPESLSFDVGCSDINSILLLPDGILFKSLKGFYFIDRGLSLSYIGNAVHEFNDSPVKSSLIVEKENEARFYLESGKTLVFHYLLQEWDTFTYSGDSAVNINGDVYFVKDKNIYKNDNTFTFDDTFYSMKVVTPWLKISSLQGFQRVYRSIVTGEYKSPHDLVIRAYFDYDDTYFEDHVISVDGSNTLPNYSFDAHIGNQKCSAIKFEIFDNPTSGGESMELNVLSVQYGAKKGVKKSNIAQRF
jgi:hypothetical protein